MVARVNGVGRVGAAVSARRRKEAAKARAATIAHAWPLPSDAYPTAELLARAGLSRNTAIKHLGKRSRVQAAYQRRMKAQALHHGDMVVCPDGCLGILVELGLRETRVTFGPGGPVRTYHWKSLRRATLAEIKEAGLLGVGCTQATEAMQT